MRRKKILMLNASTSDVPLILAAREEGFYVVTTSNKPDYIGHKYSDEYIPCNYMDFDALVELCKKNNITAVSCGVSDGASFPASYLTEYFGWKGHDSYANIGKLHNKDEFKALAKKIGLKAPVSEGFDSVEAALTYTSKLTYPTIVKPVDLGGGQGISVVNNAQEYAEAVNIAINRSKIKRIVVEPYIVGSQHSFSSFLIDQRVVHYCTWNDLNYPGRYMVSKGSFPASYENADYIDKTICGEIEKIASELKLVDGLFHLQYIVSNGEPYIIEVMRRTPGNWDTWLSSIASGVEWNRWIIRAEAGMDCHGFPMGRKQSGFWGYYAVLGSKNGVMIGIHVSDEIKNNILRFDRWVDDGFEITDFEHQKLALCHFWFSSKEEMDWKMDKIDELIQVKYE